MKNFIIAIWLIFAAFVIVPIGIDFVTGQPEDEVTAIIEREAEADDIVITAVEKHGNKAMYAFTAGDDFGVAIFSNFADNYKYSEGAMSNGQADIDVYLNTGWDVYIYKVTWDGARQVAFERFGGEYRNYAIGALAMAVISLIAVLIGRRVKKKHEEQRKKGLRQ